MRLMIQNLFCADCWETAHVTPARAEQAPKKEFAALDNAKEC